MLNFYMTPGSCSTGIHIILEELELIFAANIVNLVRGDQRAEEFLAINAKGTIPVLVLDDGTPLTSFASIAWWLGKQYPKANLIPDDPVKQARVLELLNYAVSHIHGVGYTRIFTPDVYLNKANQNEQSLTELKTKGEKIVMDGFEWLAGQMGEPYACGEFTIADAAIFYVEFWADKTQIELPERCKNHYQKMLSRPIVRQVLAEEGYRT